MNVLIVCPGFPAVDGKGYQVRAFEQIEHLAQRHAVTVVTGGQPPTDGALAALERRATVHVVAAHRAARAGSALVGALHGRPLQIGWVSTGRLQRHTRRESEHADAVIVTTIRCLPTRLAAPTLLDHVDPLSRNMRHRAALERNPVLALGARIEARLLARHEARAASWVKVQTVVSPLDVDTLPPAPEAVVLPLVWHENADAHPAAERDLDVILSGNMHYPPNRDAARWLADEIAPRLRAARPGIRIAVVGRSADRLDLEEVEVAADVDDVGAWLRRAKVAAVPLRTGTGAPIKLLEAVAAGAAVVATPRAAQAIGVDVDTAEGARDFAHAVEGLLADEPLRERRVAAARRDLERRRPGAVGAELERLLTQVAGVQV